MSKILEITIDAFGEDLLKNTEFDNVMTFCCFLSYGDIKDIEKQKIKTLNNIVIPINSQLSKLNTINENKIRIWNR